MALLEAQDRIGRMLREIELKRSSSRIFEPPSPIRNAPDWRAVVFEACRSRSARSCATDGRFRHPP